MKLLYVCDADIGGIAEYAIRQSRALADVGAEVSFLCRPTFPLDRLCRVNIISDLPTVPSRARSVWLRAIRQIFDWRKVAQIVADRNSRGDYDAILFASYREYFAPFWALILRRTAGRGIRIGTVAHDPVRDFVLGPVWWHRWSVRQAYSFVSHVFAHDETPIDLGGLPQDRLQPHIIPHGCYDLPAARQSRSKLRKQYGFQDDDRIFLSFGQVRDGKNLDRFLRAMTALPEKVKLLVAGSEAGGSQRSPQFYIDLARQLGLEHRCRWDLRYVPTEETGDLFAVADYVLMTYSARFRSASGVMNAAVYARKAILGSSGPGPFKSALEKYNLGVHVAPDDDQSLIAGAKTLLDSPPLPQWERYEAENSWEENARRVITVFSSSF